MKYKKSEAQRQKEIEAVKQYMDLIYNQGMNKGDAAAIVGRSQANLITLKRAYVPSTFEAQLQENDFDPRTWDHGWLKLEGSSIHIKNKEDIVEYKDVRDEMIKAMDNHSPKYKKIERKKTEDPHLLIVDIADMHIGKYGAASETPTPYNLEIAKDRVRDSIGGLIEKTSGFNIDKILFIMGNDALHVDSPTRRTTAGTFQDTDGQWHEAFIVARELHVHLVESLLPIADVHCLFNPSNHDYMSGFMLADSISSWFRQSPNITFDIDMNHRKYFRYGESLIGSTHGDGAKEKDLTKLMATESKDLWAKTSFRYWYCHHIHHKVAKDDIGATIEYLRSVTTADRWHSDNGYISKPAAEAFLHSKDRGQLARITHYV